MGMPPPKGHKDYGQGPKKSKTNKKEKYLYRKMSATEYVVYFLVTIALITTLYYVVNIPL